MEKCIRMHEQDNIATVLAKVAPGDVLALCDADMHVVGTVTATCDIPFAHKIALHDIADGGDVRKYGVRIGVTNRPIPAGDYVHIHNLISLEGRKGADA